MTQAYPLQWPDGWPRTPAHQRRDGRAVFRLGTGADRRYYTIASATKTLRSEVNALGGDNLVVSSMLKRRNDGLPYSNQRAPDDVGVAVYFELDGESVVMARDAFQRVEENTRSLALAISGLRLMERHGGGTMLKRAFQGFTALPPPGKMTAVTTPVQRNWWDVLGVPPDAPMNIVNAVWRELSRTASETEQYALNAAKEQASAGVSR